MSELTIAWEGKHVGSGVLRAGVEIRAWSDGRVDLKNDRGQWARAAGEAAILVAELQERIRMMDGALEEGTFWFDYADEASVRQLLRDRAALRSELERVRGERDLTGKILLDLYRAVMYREGWEGGPTQDEALDAANCQIDNLGLRDDPAEPEKG